MIFLQDFNRHLFSGEELALNPLLQLIDVLFMNQSGTDDINADRASIPGSGHLLHLYQLKKLSHIICNM